MSSKCFHCNEDVPNEFNVFIRFKEELQPVCCYGCEAVTNEILENGLEDYYTFRTDSALKAEGLSDDLNSLLDTFDDNDFQQDFLVDLDHSKETHLKSVVLSIEGMTCAACAWLIERDLNKLNGVTQVNVNSTSLRASVTWDTRQLSLSDILKNIHRIGYQALPFNPDDEEQKRNQENKNYIVRLGVAGIMTMQVMMLAFALYFGVFEGIEQSHQDYLQWISLILSTPVIFYSAFPFLHQAFNALKRKSLNMEVPVSIAIYGAYTASAVATVNNTGEVYFESICMFTFLLLLGKYLEFRARMRATEFSVNLLKYIPINARLLQNNQTTNIPAKKLNINDVILVKAGEIIPADAEIITGITSVNEAMMTGEHAPVTKQEKDTVFAGTVNHDGVITAKVLQRFENNRINSIIALQDKTLLSRPSVSKLTDLVAQWFTLILLTIATLTYFYWTHNDNPHAFWITISVLVATCPCALSLATPTALTGAIASLTRSGIIIKKDHVFETVRKLTHFAFDKTGTLTQGEFAIEHVECIEPKYSKTAVLSLAAGLEAYSEHPIAKAFAHIDKTEVTNIAVVAGYGITGNHNADTLYFGKHKSTAYEDFQSVLTINDQPIAYFKFTDILRENAPQTIAQLSEQHIEPLVLTGDNSMAAEQVANTLHINTIKKGCTPVDKVHEIEQLTQQGAIVGMIGDGINDSPVFNASHLSIAMNSGADIAKSTADVILTKNDLSGLSQLIKKTHFTYRVIKQNLAWALGYNLVILPIAISGNLPPWLAVIGMSGSSLIVVINSLRLAKV
ncbi:heavy metal translocating P-type ATPase [Flocculibacter collagenilyticus]|uniref:heavy metal translocating P-type ATPase n=1 Tax=Flocculibacter collagenilyticus TaxID=2744479 RepID=UPI0018F2AFCD|nr:heavy metal translocating P-type ATPase [Flocculibacter collagenilyticus]